ncbi:hypothetical protein GGR52DRAFT_315244 [Hypoxylon sp. FL1284]|nr:hypothetical protein GGR52DRAFT_315244 [Hypoxylon sp. FL1284]
MFQEYRQGPAGIVVPSYPSDALPEMACFPSACSCVYYKGEGAESPSDAAPSSNSSALIPHQCPARHTLSRGYGIGNNGQQIDISRHGPGGEDTSQCLITRYRRDILVFSKKALVGKGDTSATHAWLHALDPATYQNPSTALSRCMDENCVRYRQ